MVMALVDGSPGIPLDYHHRKLERQKSALRAECDMLLDSIPKVIAASIEMLMDHMLPMSKDGLQILGSLKYEIPIFPPNFATICIHPHDAQVVGSIIQ